jgi:hypothetical protein
MSRLSLIVAVLAGVVGSAASENSLQGLAAVSQSTTMFPVNFMEVTQADELDVADDLDEEEEDEGGEIDDYENVDGEPVDYNDQENDDYDDLDDLDEKDYNEATYEDDDYAGEGETEDWWWNSGGSGSGSSSSSDGSELAEGFADGFFDKTVNCPTSTLATLTSDLAGVSKVFNNIAGCFDWDPSSSECNSQMVDAVLANVMNGAQQAASAIGTCERGSTSGIPKWKRIENGLLSFRGRLVSRVYPHWYGTHVVVNGVNIYSELKNAYEDCKSGSNYFHCGQSIGQLVYWAAPEAPTSMPPLLGGTWGSVSYNSDGTSPYSGSNLMFTALYHSEYAYCMPTISNPKSWNFNKVQYTQGFQLSQTISISSISLFAFVGYQSDINTAVVSFRGTEDLTNWITNIDTIRTSYPLCDGCGVHQGFYSAEQQALPQVMEALTAVMAQYPSASVLVTGHSLGAALATLTALDIAHQQPSYDVTLWNFGSPRIFDEYGADWAGSSESGISIGGRRTHYQDIVPHLPPFSFGFYHVDNEIYEGGPISSYPNFPGGPMVKCEGEENPYCADQWSTATSVADHLLYNGVKMGTGGCSVYE